MLRKDIMGRGGGGGSRSECYYTSRKLYQHMKYSYTRKQIAMRTYGAN